MLQISRGSFNSFQQKTQQDELKPVCDEGDDNKTEEHLEVAQNSDSSGMSFDDDSQYGSTLKRTFT